MKPSSVFDYIARSEGGAIELDLNRCSGDDGVDMLSMHEAKHHPLSEITGVCALGAIGVAYRDRPIIVAQTVVLKLARSLGFVTDCSCLNGVDQFGCACTASPRAQNFVADWHDESGRTLKEVRDALVAIGE